MDMSKYKPLFLSETAEHFDSLEAELIALDEKGGDIGHINEVFRHLHSIKSMSASMGYTPLSTLAHRLEDLVGFHRESSTPVVSGEIDILLRGLDELRQMLQSARTDSPLPSISPRLSAELDTEVEKRSSMQNKPSSPGPLDELSLSTKDHLPSWTIRIDMSPQCPMPGVRAFMALHRLSMLGQITKSDPSQDALKQGKLPQGAITIVIDTRRSEAELRDALGKIPNISQVDIRPTVTKKPAPATPPAQQVTPSVPIDHQTVRVRTELLDFFVNSVGELITLRSFFEDLSDNHEIPLLNDGVRRMGSVVRKLQERIMEVRMVPVSALTTQFPRVCRDLARRRSKQVSLTIQGTEVELDRSLVQSLANPMLHMLRNAVEHGIETPEQRLRQGKPEQGTISITFHRRHDRVIIQMADDGAGIDEKQLLSKALRMGIIKSPDEYHEQKRYELIFEPGLSAKDDVTDVSGRGVGMDVVKETIQRLGGQVTVSSTPGHGTTFTLDLPFTLAIIQILTVQVGEHLLALPASRVTKAMPLDKNRISSTETFSAIRFGNKQYQYQPLAEILKIPVDKDEETTREVVLVGDENNASLALGVDRLMGHREAVLKPIGDLLHRIGPFSSSTVLGDGSPVLILDVDELLTRALSSEVHDE